MHGLTAGCGSGSGLNSAFSRTAMVSAAATIALLLACKKENDRVLVRLLCVSGTLDLVHPPY